MAEIEPTPTAHDDTKLWPKTYFFRNKLAENDLKQMIRIWPKIEKMWPKSDISHKTWTKLGAENLVKI
jgi:hypothetical protein